MSVIQFVSEWSLRSATIIAAGALLLWLLRVRSPKVRLAAWNAILAGSLLLPVLRMPKLPVMVRPAAHTVVATMAPATPAERMVVPPPAVPGRSGFDWRRPAGAVYLAISAGLFLRLLVAAAFGVRIWRRSRPAGFTFRGNEVRESDAIASPAAVGLIRPGILLPADWHEWSEEKRAAVLAHEASHIQRRDPMVQFVSQLHRALLWVNPLSWYLDRALVRTAEQASDDDAMSVTANRTSYAEILLDFVQRNAGQPQLAGIQMARYERPEQRIRRILSAAVIPRAAWWSFAGVLLAACSLTFVMAAVEPEQPLPRFEAASIKPVDRTPGSAIPVGFQVYPGRLEGYGLPLKTLIAAAFRVPYFQLEGGEEWMEKERFNVIAKTPSGTTLKSLRYTWYTIADEQLRQMLQALLIDRCQLKVHRETTTGDVYVMERTTRPLALRKRDLPDTDYVDNKSAGNMGYAGGQWNISAASMAELAEFAASAVLRAPVTDGTGLKGIYDYRQKEPDVEPVYGGDQSSSFLNFMREVGLRLRKTTGPVEKLVIDSAQRPTEN